MSEALKKLRVSESPGENSGAAILKSLSEDELIDLLNSLKLFAARRYYGTLNSDDLAMQAITEVLENRRTWNSSLPPFQNLCWIIRSIASNQLGKERRTVSFNSEARRTSVDSVLISNPASTYPSPADDYEARETHRKISDLLQQAISGDSLLRRIIVFALNKDRWRPKEIASELNISEPEVYNARRRIRRKLEMLLGKSGGGEVL